MKNKPEEKAITSKGEMAVEPYKMSQEDQELMFGDMGAEDLSIPRITVLQGLSPEVSEGLGTPGDLFVKGLNQNLGKAAVEIIPLLRNRSRIRWKAMDDGGGILCQALDGLNGVGDPGGDCQSCNFKEWIVKDPKSGKMKPGCDLFQNVICVLRKEEEWVPMALSGSRTKLKALKDLNSLLMLEQQKGRPIFGKSYTLKAVKKSSGAISYFNLSITPGNGNQVLPDVEVHKAAKLFQGFLGKTIRVDQTPESQHHDVSDI